MELELIKGHFDPQDAVDIITRIINVKIKYHESKIGSESTEEDIKMREGRIKGLQKELFDVRNYVEKQSGKINLHSTLTITD